MTLKCYQSRLADIKHFVDRKASLNMLAGTTTAQVLKIYSANQSGETCLMGGSCYSLCYGTNLSQKQQCSQNAHSERDQPMEVLT